MACPGGSTKATKATKATEGIKVTKGVQGINGVEGVGGVEGLEGIGGGALRSPSGVPEKGSPSGRWPSEAAHPAPRRGPAGGGPESPPENRTEVVCPGTAGSGGFTPGFRRAPPGAAQPAQPVVLLQGTPQKGGFGQVANTVHTPPPQGTVAPVLGPVPRFGCPVHPQVPVVGSAASEGRSPPPFPPKQPAASAKLAGPAAGPPPARHRGPPAPANPPAGAGGRQPLGFKAAGKYPPEGPP